jgi:hypothetical protein
MEGGSLAMSADGNAITFCLFDRPALINASHFYDFLDFYGSAAI